jgi:hypothetical protein
MSGRAAPAWASASKAMPPVMAPSPMTATTRRGSASRAAAMAMPMAAEMLVEEWPTPKVSYSLSLRFGKPDSPPAWRIVCMLLHAAGEDLVRVGLVADVPHEAVARRVEDVVQGDGELHDAEPGTEMAAGLAHAEQQILPQFIGEVQELGFVEGRHAPSAINGIEERGPGSSGRELVEHWKIVA